MEGLIRQGDILLVPVSDIPNKRRDRVRRKKDDDIILAEGEVTGHHHRIPGTGTTSVTVYDDGSNKHIRVRDDDGVSLAHEEHDTLTIPKGDYRVENQREYVPQAAPRRVYD